MGSIRDQGQSGGVGAARPRRVAAGRAPVCALCAAVSRPAALDGAGEFGRAARRELPLAWLDIHQGRFDSAFRRLRDGHTDSAEATLLLAIASQATDHIEELAAALKTARRLAADTSLLLQPAAAPAGEHHGTH